MMPVALQLTVHAALRAAERLDLLLTQRDADAILARIHDGTFHLIGRREGRAAYGAVYQGRGCILVVSEDALLTVLEPGGISMDGRTDTDRRRAMAQDNSLGRAKRRRRDVIRSMESIEE